MRVSTFFVVVLVISLGFFAFTEATLEVSDVKLAIVGGDGVRKTGESLTYPSKLSKPLSLEGLDTLRLSFQIKDKSTQEGIQPHQTFLVLTNEDNDVDTVLVVQVRDSGRARLDLDLNSAREELTVAPHTYQLTLLIGTFSHADPLKYSLGSLIILPPLDVSGKRSATKEPVVFGPLPIIEHVFRKPEKMPPALFSIVFAGIVLSPWLILTIGWASIGVTPASLGPLFHPTILTFYFSLLAIDYLFYIYWTKFNIFQTLGYLAPLAAISFVSGQRALTEVQKRRELAQGKEKKAE